MSGTGTTGTAVKPFDKYELRGDYHWQEYHSETVYSDYVHGLKAWVTGERVLDVGAGDGLISHVLGLSDAIDTNETAIELAARHGVKVQRADARLLPFHPGEFDSVFIGDVIEHIGDDLQVLRECWRVLKSGGLLFLTTPPGVEGDPPGEYDVRNYTMAGICHLVRAAGFRIDSLPFIQHGRIHVRAVKWSGWTEFVPYTSIRNGYDHPSGSLVSILDREVPRPGEGLGWQENRCDKMRPFGYFPGARWTLYADGSAKWKRDPYELFRWARAQDPSANLFLFRHNERDCPYEEAAEIERLGLDYPDRVAEMVRLCKEEGIEPHSGLFSAGVIIADCSDECCVFFSHWLSMYLEHGFRRDQVILPVALKKSDVRLGVLPHSILDHFIEWRPHLVDRRLVSTDPA
jgi:SAM-dependent methyltransferase